MRYSIQTGKVPTALKACIYGVEGIGKSTLASKLPKPLFIDVEGGSKQLDVGRMPKPTSWEMLLDEVRDVRDNAAEYGCKTLVVDTIDAAERLCTEKVCAEHKWRGIEDAGYGKGYVYLRDEFGKLMDLLSEVVDRGVHAVCIAHAILSKFERPDENGAYDRWSMKLMDTKRCSDAAMVKEWADMLLFCDYRTIVTTSTSGKAKAAGNERIVRTTHDATYDAKNRFNLPETVPLDDMAGMLSDLMDGESPATGETGETVEAMANPQPETSLPTALTDLMERDSVTETELREAVASTGTFPIECPVELYGEDYIEYLVANWGGVMKSIRKARTARALDEADAPDFLGAVDDPNRNQ